MFKIHIISQLFQTYVLKTVEKIIVYIAFIGIRINTTIFLNINECFIRKFDVRKLSFNNRIKMFV